jgi:hypothetical protein
MACRGHNLGDRRRLTQQALHANKSITVLCYTFPASPTS